jgi:5-methylcytosine-specific restriction endonuclease McrA
MRSTPALDTIPDDELLRRLVDLLRQSRHAEADLVAHIGEVDARRLYTREASPSMFAYCTERLHLSDAEAYLRITAARASREHPALLEMLADGRLHLSAIAKLAPHLTPENKGTLLQRAAHRSKRQIEELIAELVPRPDVPSLVRKLPERRIVTPLSAALRSGPDEATPEAPGVSLAPDGEASADSELAPKAQAPQVQLRPDAVAAARPIVIEPLTPTRYRIQFTASAEPREKLERLRGLMRTSVPDGDLAAVIELAVTEKLERLEARRFGRTKAERGLPAGNGAFAAAAAGPLPRSQSSTSKGDVPALRGSDSSTPAAARRPVTSRHIPAAVRRAVYARDGGQCCYVDAQGQRCTAREGLEFHHRHPFGYGGGCAVGGISLLCRAHNRHLAEADYGRETIARHRRLRSESRSLPLRI